MSQIILRTSIFLFLCYNHYNILFDRVGTLSRDTLPAQHTALVILTGTEISDYKLLLTSEMACSTKLIHRANKLQLNYAAD